jgi:uncharacterized protein YjbI with pentapeptide repeats
MTLGYPPSASKRADAFSGVAGISDREEGRACLRLDEAFMVARRHAAALVLARRACDEAVGTVAAARLRRTLLHAIGIVHAVGMQDGEMHAILVATFNEATPAMCELLQRAPTSIAALPRQRVSASGGATARLFEVRGGRSHVFGLDASGRELQEAAVCGLHISHSRFITDMRRAHFADALVEASDFSYADLRDTLWQRARVRSCYFREARFSDAAFDDTMFIDCDMRGADFSMDSVDLSTTPGVTFIRCDLRGACWGGRDHTGFELLNCQVFDAADLAAPIAHPDEPRHVSPVDSDARSLAQPTEGGGGAARRFSRVSEGRTQ